MVKNGWWPRAYQIPLLDSHEGGCKRAMCVWHRRAGKDLTALNLTIGSTVTRPGIYYHCLPKTNQGRKVIWDGMDGKGRKFLDYWPKSLLLGEPNATEMKLNTSTGAMWQVIGADNFDNVMGTNPVGIVFSEFSLQAPRAWDYFRPILLENGGWAIFLFTPRGRNHAYDLYLQARDNPEWYCEKLTVNDTKVITTEGIESERRSGMSQAMIDQEFYCSFETAAPGAYYANEMRQAQDEGRITKVPYVGGAAIDTWWDLGMDDSTSIWFTQDVGREIHVIDYYESRGEGLEHYATVLEKKLTAWRGSYRKHYAPHDIKVRELGTGKTRLKLAHDLGIRFQVVERPLRKEDGIQAVRDIMPICWFDEGKCRYGIDGLLSYRSEYDESNRVYRVNPVHDWASHPADAFQTLGLAHGFDQVDPSRDRVISQMIEAYL